MGTEGAGTARAQQATREENQTGRVETDEDSVQCCCTQKDRLGRLSLGATGFKVAGQPSVAQPGFL